MPPRIPIKPLIPYIRDYLAKYETGSMARYQAGMSTSPITFLSSRSGISRDGLYKMVEGKTETIDFDIADKIICESVGPMIWQTDPDLREIYYEADLSDSGIPVGHVVCKRRNCENTFPRPKGQGSRKKFCTPTCKNLEWGYKHGLHKNREKTCRNDHVRTEENTYILPSGNKCCRICRNAATKAYKRRKRGTL